jgi:excinuclease ABC subunit C
MSILKNKIISKDLIRHLNKDLPNDSGIYKMFDSKNNLMYIGKAKNLKNRIYSYSSGNLSPRIEHMVSQIHDVQWIITKDEQDALLLESQLIKVNKPKYNILLKDDKTYPYIKVDFNSNFPRILKFRSKNATPTKGLFGPFASSMDVDENIKVIQNLFKIRTCSDNIFNNRQSPCILHQIKRCSAPCVNKISKDDYQDCISQLQDFFDGKSEGLKQYLIDKMTFFANNQNYDQAIVIRDRIKNLSSLNTKQSILLDAEYSGDFIAILKQNNLYIVQIFLFRNGLNYGTLDFIIEEKIDENIEDVVQIFLLQFYTERDIPNNIYINLKINEDNKSSFKLLSDTLLNKKSKKLILQNPNNDKTKAVMDIVIANAIANLEKKELNDNKWENNFKELQNYFHLQDKIERIEIYDNSHLYGTYSLGVMVCAKKMGFDKSSYRIFNLKDVNIAGNDDYGILKEVFTRRFTKLIKNNESKPSLIFVDGGKGQLKIAYEVLKSLNLDDIKLIGVAKGVNRNAGEEKLYLVDNSMVEIDKYSPVLHFIQMLRNEAHRFAIKSLKKRALNNLAKSELDDIPEIGAKRKKDLLNYFGSIDNIKKATIDQLLEVKNINKQIAIKIFNWFN